MIPECTFSWPRATARWVSHSKLRLKCKSSASLRRVPGRGWLSERVKYSRTRKMPTDNRKLNDQHAYRLHQGHRKRTPRATTAAKTNHGLRPSEGESRRSAVERSNSNLAFSLRPSFRYTCPST